MAAKKFEDKIKELEVIVNDLENGEIDLDESIKKYGNENHIDIVKNGLDGLIQGKSVDLIIGGPPCQAYSLAGRAQDPNSMKNDYRNFLFESFVKIVEHSVKISAFRMNVNVVYVTLCTVYEYALCVINCLFNASSCKTGPVG